MLFQKKKVNTDYNDVVVDTSIFETAIKLMIAKNFGAGNHFKVYREAKRFRPSKSRSIQNQLSGREPEIVEVYFDNKFICDVREDMQPDYALALIQSSLINKLSAT